MEELFCAECGRRLLFADSSYFLRLGGPVKPSCWSVMLANKGKADINAVGASSSRTSALLLL